MIQKDLFGNAIQRRAPGKLADEWGAYPFTVLNAREGWWQDRKHEWQNFGIRSEVGRDAPCYNTHSTEYMTGAPEGHTGTSIFDPVLTELMYRWFCPPGGQILDPFAGGSVRGIVAACEGYRYHGTELRPEQVAANRMQRHELLTAEQAERLHWRTMDARDIGTEAPEADLVFTCPPYGDLEVYSDDPRDLSTMDYPQFLAGMEAALGAAVSRLRRHRFLVIVVGDFRDRHGLMRGFTTDTVNIGRRLGLGLYNQAILLTAVGTAAMRANKQFRASRKLCKIHQDVLVFVNGDPRKATQAIGG